MNQCLSYNSQLKRLCTGGKLLPSEYQQVEYLENSGNQYIDTGINVTSTLKTTIRFSVADYIQYSTYARLFGAAYYTGSDANTSYFVAFMSATQLRIPKRTSSSTNGTVNININSISNGEHTLEYRSGEILLDSSLISSDTYVTTKNINVYLFAMNVFYQNAWNNYGVPGFRVYRAQLGTASNATEYRDLVPCYRKSDHKPGMYDIIHDNFYTNAGSGEFTVGKSI